FIESVGELGLSPMQAHTLRFLEHPVPMNELAETLWCDASNVTGIVDRLEARGLVERRPSPDDRRVKLLCLTDEGEALRDRDVERSDRLRAAVEDRSRYADLAQHGLLALDRVAALADRGEFALQRRRLDVGVTRQAR